MDTDESPPALQVRPVFVGQRFETSKELRVATQQTFLSSHRWCKDAGGGGNQKFFACTGRKLEGKVEVGCPARVRAYRSKKTNLWGITVADLDHRNCTGEQNGASVSALQGVISTLVGANPGMRATSLKKTIKAQTGIDVHVRSALRGKMKALHATSSGVAEGFTVLSSFLSQLTSKSNGTVTSVQVRTLEIKPQPASLYDFTSII